MYPSNTFPLPKQLTRGVHHFEGGVIPPPAPRRPSPGSAGFRSDRPRRLSHPEQGSGRRPTPNLMAGSDGTPNRRMDCRGAEKGNLARELGAHHYIAENPDNARARTTHGRLIIRFLSIA